MNMVGRLGARGATAVLLLATGTVALAQPTESLPTSAPTGRGLIRHTDPAFGFEINVPAGWNYDRSRFQQFEDSIGLLRGRDPTGQRALQIMVFRTFPMKPFEDWVVDFGKALGELGRSSKVEWETWRLPPRAGAVLTYASKIGADFTQTHCLCVPFDPNTVWVFVYSGNAYNDEARQRIRQEFDELAATLQVHYDAEAAEKLAPAFERGRALIERLRKQASQARVDDTEYCYELVVAGKPSGYFTRRATREEYTFSEAAAKHRFAKEGLCVREQAWRFADDGTVRSTRVFLFSSFDLRSELIETEETEIPPGGGPASAGPAGAAPPRPLVVTEQAIREDDVLFSSVTTSRDQVLPDPGKPIHVGPVYLDQAWLRLLAGLLLGGGSDEFAVATYNADTRAVLTYVMKPVGQRPVPGTSESAFAFEYREGFLGGPHLLYCDARGNLVRLESGDLVVRRVPREEIEKKYGPRRDEAMKRLGAAAK